MRQAVALRRCARAASGLGLRAALDALAATGEVLAVAALVADVAITFASTALRYLAGADLPWAADISTLLIAVTAFVGAPALFRRSGLMAYTALVERLPPRAGATLQALGLWIAVAVAALALLRYPTFLSMQARQALPVLGLHAGYAALWLGIGLVLLVLFALERLAALGQVSLRAAVPVVLGAIAVAAGHWGYAAGVVEVEPFWLILPALAATFAAGTPIPLILALGGALYFVLTGDAPLVAIPSALQYGVGSFLLLAIPFFMAAGVLMEVTGMAQRLVEMVQRWVGHWPGGLLIAEVVATYVFSGISGSKAADMATIGAVMKGPMRARGYPASEFAAVLCASAAMSETVPPSLAMLLLGSVTSLSVGALFIAGIVPALVLTLALIVGVVLRARRYGWAAGEPFALGRAVAGLGPALPALGVPAIVIGGIVGGLASPTESGSLAVVYALVAAVLGGRRIGVARIYAALRDAALTAGMILLLVAAANLLAQAIVVDGLGTAVAAALGSFHGRLGFLAFSVGALIVIGFLLEGFPAVLIAAPIFLPAAAHMGVDPLQFGILLIMATGIGVMLPPLGIGFYIACSVGDAPATPAMRASLSYNLCLLAGLAIVVLVPPLTLWLPHLLGLA